MLTPETIEFMCDEILAVNGYDLSSKVYRDGVRPFSQASFSARYSTVEETLTHMSVIERDNYIFLQKRLEELQPEEEEQADESEESESTI